MVGCGGEVARWNSERRPLTTANLLNDKVIPRFEGQDIVANRVQTDRGTAFCSNHASHEYELNPAAKLYRSIGDIQADLDEWVRDHTTEHTRRGRRCCGKTPM